MERYEVFDTFKPKPKLHVKTKDKPKILVKNHKKLINEYLKDHIYTVILFAYKSFMQLK